MVPSLRVSRSFHRREYMSTCPANQHLYKTKETIDYGHMQALVTYLRTRPIGLNFV
jgi:hypothetical protein